MPDKPLHVQVAEALGWFNCNDRGDGLWQGMHISKAKTTEIPRFDLSWCHTGPLIEHFRLAVDCAEAEKPLEYVCHTIVSLHKEGKLKA